MRQFQSRSLILLVAVMVSETALAGTRLSANSVPVPTALERLAAQAGTEVAQAEVIGQIQSGGTRLSVTALILEDPHSTASPVRGVRMDLANDTTRISIYIDEGGLHDAKKELRRLDCGVKRVRVQPSSPVSIRGVARCRPSRSVPQSYCPAYVVEAEFEGLGVSTFSGHRFRFDSVRPGALAELIEGAISQFALTAPAPDENPIQLPADDVERIVASSIRHFPKLGASPGVKAAGYSVEFEKKFAYAIFWPYSREGDFARSLSVECTLNDGEARDWNCDEARARGYLTLPNQAREVVITGPLEPDEALSLIAFGRDKLREHLQQPSLDGWYASMLRPPDDGEGSFLLGWRNNDADGVMFVIDRGPHDGAAPFSLKRTLGGRNDPCR